MPFFISDENVLLSFDVAKGDTMRQAEAQHTVKLTAIVDALGSLSRAETERHTIADLRGLSQLHH